jgi:hypothetical protein
VDGVPTLRCSGTLISPRIFLTAGHCTYGASAVRVWFYSDMTYNTVPFPLYPYGGKGSGATEGTPYTHPQYDPNAFYLYDLGVVVLDKPVKMGKYGALPALDILDKLVNQRGQQDVSFTSVGYGLQLSFPDATSWKDSAARIRMVAYPKLDQINTGFTGTQSLVLSNNAATGGTCFGDSGGPNFIDGSNIVGAVTSFGINDTCGGTGGVYRVDRADDLAWLATFGVTP